jgi:hypothetical protein
VRSDNPLCIIVIMATPTLFGDPSVLREQGGLRLPGWPPRLVLSRLWPGRWRPLFRPDPTGVDTGDGGTSNRKPDDHSRAKCGARKCRKYQDPLPITVVGNNNPQIALSSSADRHEMQI